MRENEGKARGINWLNCNHWPRGAEEACQRAYMVMLERIIDFMVRAPLFSSSPSLSEHVLILLLRFSLAQCFFVLILSYPVNHSTTPTCPSSTSIYPTPPNVPQCGEDRRPWRTLPPCAAVLPRRLAHQAQRCQEAAQPHPWRVLTVPVRVPGWIEGVLCC
jgi:hypothetical protein